jgi:hypothetical protein
MRSLPFLFCGVVWAVSKEECGALRYITIVQIYTVSLVTLLLESKVLVLGRC